MTLRPLSGSVLIPPSEDGGSEHTGTIISSGQDGFILLKLNVVKVLGPQNTEAYHTQTTFGLSAYIYTLGQLRCDIRDLLGRGVFETSSFSCEPSA